LVNYRGMSNADTWNLFRTEEVKGGEAREKGHVYEGDTVVGRRFYEFNKVPTPESLECNLEKGFGLGDKSAKY